MVLERIWMVVRPGNEGVVHAIPGKNAEEAWDNAVTAIEDYYSAKNDIRKRMHDDGYRARRLDIVFR